MSRDQCCYGLSVFVFQLIEEYRLCQPPLQPVLFPEEGTQPWEDLISKFQAVLLLSAHSTNMKGRFTLTFSIQ